MSSSTEYEVCSGGVQPYVRRYGDSSEPLFVQHFGRAEYDSSKPVLSESLRVQGQAVCDALNSDEISEQEAIERLRQIYF